jgi:hypothetical protein
MGANLGREEGDEEVTRSVCNLPWGEVGAKASQAGFMEGGLGEVGEIGGAIDVHPQPHHLQHPA